MWSERVSGASRAAYLVAALAALACATPAWSAQLSEDRAYRSAGFSSAEGVFESLGGASTEVEFALLQTVSPTIGFETSAVLEDSDPADRSTSSGVASLEGLALVVERDGLDARIGRITTSFGRFRESLPGVIDDGLAVEYERTGQDGVELGYVVAGHRFSASVAVPGRHARASEGETSAAWTVALDLAPAVGAFRPTYHVAWLGVPNGSRGSGVDSGLVLGGRLPVYDEYGWSLAALAEVAWLEDGSGDGPSRNLSLGLEGRWESWSASIVLDDRDVRGGEVRNQRRLELGIARDLGTGRALEVGLRTEAGASGCGCLEGVFKLTHAFDWD